MKPWGTRATLLRQGYGVPSIDGQADRPNGAIGEKRHRRQAAMVAASELGNERVSNARERMSLMLSEFRPDLGLFFRSAKVTIVLLFQCCTRQQIACNHSVYL